MRAKRASFIAATFSAVALWAPLFWAALSAAPRFLLKRSAGSFKCVGGKLKHSVEIQHRTRKLYEKLVEKIYEERFIFVQWS